MEFPYFPRPRYEQSFRGMPVQVNPKAAQPQPLKPKVVSIPVHFVGSEQSGRSESFSKMNRSDSAIKIQKVFRGFLVRKNMEKIRVIREEVNAIELNVSKTETVDLLRKDSKERLKVNEILMSLLLKLDSIKGVDSGVRDCRKSVIKKAIALQERVDAIVSGDQQSLDSNNAEAVDQDQSQGTITGSADNCDQTLELQNDDDMIEQCQVEFVPSMNESEVVLQNEGTVDESNNEQVVATQEQDEEDGEKNMQKGWAESQTDSSANPGNLVKLQDAAAADKNETCFQPDVETENEGNNINSEKGDFGVENKKSKEMLQRIMEDNEKMMGLMQVLCEKNEMQTRLLNALSQRVEQLEKAYMCDKLRRKKKRNAASVDCEVKKWGKK